MRAAVVQEDMRRGATIGLIDTSADATGIVGRWGRGSIGIVVVRMMMLMERLVVVRMMVESMA